jgi:membrane protease YdiL (CAAX protease family)
MDAPLLSGQEPPAFRWQRMDLVAFAGFFFLTWIALSIIAALVSSSPSNGSGIYLLLLTVFLDIVVVGFIFFLIKILHRQPILPTLRWEVRERIPLLSLLFGGVFLALSAVIFSRVFPPPTDTVFDKFLTSTPSLVLLVIFGGIVGPLLEEIIFRGFIYTLLADIYSSSVAVPITSVLFAMMHVGQLRGNLPAVVWILGVGAVLTVIRNRSRSLIPSVIVHTTYNAMIFGISALSTVLDQGTKG